VAVVVPARNESELIGRCLSSMTVACEALAIRTRGRVSSSVVVVADGCTDDTAALAGTYPVSVIEVPAVGVGRARALGVSHHLGSLGIEPARLWIANTDADSMVSREWLIAQAAAATSGADALVGGVRPHFPELSSAQRVRWRASHANGRARTHVHGANFGIRASVYLQLGGFLPLAEHEDVDLASRVRGAGFRIHYAERVHVTTSGRSVGRTPGGYAAYLRGLDDEIPVQR
jgi:cellulose synthase/poly-beta-1,6-N-acetylglucosamine synthase-like glycosyltransferase